jgi:hypothetical protein
MNSKCSIFHYLTVATLLCSLSVKAQNPVSTPSPETAVFAKNGNIPVGTYTGVPNINVPLFAIKDGDINLPITLSYNASGIKVEEDAGWAGLGWSLNTGGQITRAIRGKDDFGDNYGDDHAYLNAGTIANKPLFTDGAPMQGNPYGFYSYHTMSVSNHLFYDGGAPGDPGSRFSDVLATTGGTYDFGNIHNYDAQLFDFQSDVFYFNAGNNSGKFVFDDAGNPMTFKKSKIKIERYDGLSFKITGEDGLIYKFESKREMTTELYGPNTSFLSSWYLTSIESPNGKNIVTFQYSGNIMTTNKITTYRQSVDLSGNITQYTDYSQSQINGWYLTEIDYNGGKVKFESVKDRTDVTNAMRLTAVVVTDNNNVEKKRYTLETSYFHATDIGTNTAALNTDRLKLNKITVNGDDNNAYVFDYNTDYIPSKDSGKDHWGYANHAGTGIPQGIYKVTQLIGGSPSTNYYLQSGGDYEAHWPYTPAMNLKQITYPTKGYSRFVYESNTFSNVPDYWQYQLQSTAVTTVISYPVNYIDAGSVTSATALNGNYNLSCHFYLTTASDLSSFYISFYDASNNLLYRKTLNDFDPTPDGHNFYLTVNNMPFYATTRCEVTSSRNNYSVSTSDFFQFFNLQLTTPISQNIALVPVQQVAGGGLRVKEILNNDGSGETTYKQYQYNNDAGISSGQIMSYPIYMSFAWQSNDIQFTAANFSSRSLLGLSTDAEGSYVGYSQVKELHGNTNSNIGSTMSYYTNMPDIIPYENDVNLPTEQRSENGLLTQQIAYDSNSNKISELTNNYSTFDQNNWKSTTGAYFTRYGVGDWKDNTYTIFYFYKEYQLDYKLLSSAEKLFNRTDATKYTQAFTEYQYQNSMNPRRVLKTTSLGDQQVTEYRYADDYTAASAPAFIGQMQSSNILDKPVETVNLKVTSTATLAYKGMINVYGTGDQAGLVINQYNLYTTAPVSWDNSKFTDVLANTSALNYDSHYVLKNTFGYLNLHKQVTDYTNNNINTSFKWGYNNEYPIAECKNATSGEFYYEGYEDDPTASVGTGHTGSKYTTNAIVNWTIPNSRAYVISYWYYSSGWKYSGPVAYTGNSYTMSLGTAWDDIRIYPSDVQMATFTYQPLEGMKSMTDAKGLTTTYEYDGLQRLTDVKDQYGNIVKHNDYHYQQ